MSFLNRMIGAARTAPIRLMLVFMSLSLAYLALDPWHDWGGDFAYYLGVARNIYFDRPLDTANVGIVAPSGFPWLLSKLAPMFEWQLMPLKRINLVYATTYFALILFLSNILKSAGQKVTFVALASLNMWIWSYSNQVLTEMLFLMLVTAMFTICIWSERRADRFPWRLIILFYCLAVISCSIKQAALLTLLAPPFLFLERKSDVKPIERLAIFASLCILSGLLFYFVYNASWLHVLPHSLTSQGSTGTLGKIAFMIGKIDDELVTLSAMLLADTRVLWTGIVISIIITVGAIKRLLSGNFSALVLVAGLVLPLLYVPWTPMEGRYWFPLLGALAFLLVEGGSILFSPKRMPRFERYEPILLCMLLMTLSIHHIGNAKRTFLIDRDKGVFEQNAAEAFYWIHYNTEWGKRICFFKPRILGYYANWNRVCGVDQLASPQELESVLATEADFLLVSDQYSPETWAYFQSLNPSRIVYRNQKFLVVSKAGTFQ